VCERGEPAGRTRRRSPGIRSGHAAVDQPGMVMQNPVQTFPPPIRGTHLMRCCTEAPRTEARTEGEERRVLVEARPAGSGTSGNKKPAGETSKSSFGAQSPPGNRSCCSGIKRPRIMRYNDYLDNCKNAEEVVAYFGEARLVRRLDCRFVLRGGSDDDRAEAREWMSRFWMEENLQLDIRANEGGKSARDNSSRRHR